MKARAVTNLLAALLASVVLYLMIASIGRDDAEAHRLSGHPKTVKAKLDLAKRQVAHDRRELATARTRHWALLSPLPVAAFSHRYWLRRDVRYVAALTRLMPSRPYVDSCLSGLISRESGWNVHATNPTTGAYGLPQALPGSKMASAGADWRDNAWTQIRWMIGYVNARYGGSCAALSFQKANGYY